MFSSSNCWSFGISLSPSKRLFIGIYKQPPACHHSHNRSQLDVVRRIPQEKYTFSCSGYRNQICGNNVMIWWGWRLKFGEVILLITEPPLVLHFWPSMWLRSAFQSHIDEKTRRFVDVISLNNFDDARSWTLNGSKWMNVSPFQRGADPSLENIESNLLRNRRLTADPTGS